MNSFEIIPAKTWIWNRRFCICIPFPNPKKRFIFEKLTFEELKQGNHLPKMRNGPIFGNEELRQVKSIEIAFVIKILFSLSPHQNIVKRGSKRSFL